MKKIDFDNFLVDIKDVVNIPYLGPFKLWFKKMMDAKHGMEFTDFEHYDFYGRTLGYMTFIKPEFQDLRLEVKNDYKKLVITLEELYEQYPMIFGEENYETPCHKGDMVYAYQKEGNKLFSCNNGYKVRFTGGYSGEEKPIVEIQNFHGTEINLFAVDIISLTPLLTIEEQIKECMDNKIKMKIEIYPVDIMNIINRNAIKMPTMAEVAHASVDKSEKGWEGIGLTYQVVKHFIEKK